MKLPRRKFLRLAAGAMALATTFFFATFHTARSQATFKIVVPFPPGGSADILTRFLAEQIKRTTGSAVVVENRPGADTVIGTEAVSRAAPDGNTVLIVANPFVTNPHLSKLSYDPLTSFEPICRLASSPTVIVVNSISRYRTLANLVDAARAKPGELSLASINTFRIAFEMFKRVANIDMIFVPYPGNAPAVTALLGNHVTSVFAVYPTVAEQVAAGKLRALVTTSRTRIDAMPELPTAAESGYKDYSEEAWFGVVAPAKTPKEALSRLSASFSAAIQAPETKQKLASQGLYPMGACGAEFGAYLRTRYEEYGRVIRDANIKAE
ncbi:MAG TPA: tripartite tricarboxylate transporter substrate binding protein [Xanthobacteraceae bacterium]|jgi:tripartite-type tricarboxylate transporter receptor subunit TctC